VNYYFGSRSGLIVAVAERAAQKLGGRLELAYGSEGTIEERIMSAVADPIRVLADDPQLAQLFLDELVIHGDETSDPALHALARPYLRRLQELVDEGITSGELRDVDPQLRVYALGALPLLFRITAPLFQRSFGELGVTREPAAFSAALADILLNGAKRRQPIGNELSSRAGSRAADAGFPTPARPRAGRRRAAAGSPGRGSRRAGRREAALPPTSQTAPRWPAGR
jgi:TetR/AcrR family transcriptional regulator